MKIEDIKSDEEKIGKRLKKEKSAIPIITGGCGI